MFRYRDKVNMFSDMWRDEKTSAFDEAIYWMELLLKYGNLDHLRINDHHLNLFQYLCHDVLLFFLLILIAMVYLTYRLTKYVVQRIEGDAKLRKSKSHKAINNNSWEKVKQQ